MDLTNLMGKIPNEHYHHIVKSTQLISIDLLVKYQGKYLLGKRKNKPAQGYYFVPGGKVYNNETIFIGLKRVIFDELGLTENLNYRLIGVYEHVYPDNYLNDEFGTHYVAFAFEIFLANDQMDCNKFMEQHQDFIYLEPEQLLSDDRVHTFTKNYFMRDPNNIVISLHDLR